MSWSDFGEELLVVKPEPRACEQMPRLVLPGRGCNEPADADLLDIKLEDLCYATRQDGQGFVFVEPKGCDDIGYDTSASLSPQSNEHSIEHSGDCDWLDSPSSVDSLLSSCKDFCAATNSAPLTLAPQDPSISLLDIIPQQQQSVFQQELHNGAKSSSPVPVIQSKPIIPTLLMFPAPTEQNSRYIHPLINLIPTPSLHCSHVNSIDSHFIWYGAWES